LIDEFLLALADRLNKFLLNFEDSHHKLSAFFSPLVDSIGNVLEWYIPTSFMQCPSAVLAVVVSASEGTLAFDVVA
jgi:hypothetical protein